MKTHISTIGLNRLKVIMLFFFIGIISFSCRNNENKENAGDDLDTEVATETETRPVDVRAYTGKINALKNSEEISGEVAVRIEGDLARFHISAKGLTPEMMHMQYLLVSQTGNQTECPTDVAQMGVNQNNTTGIDGDLKRIPLHRGTTTMDLNITTYPRTNVNGELDFTRTVSLDSMQTAVSSEFAKRDLDFNNITFVIRGIPDGESNKSGQNRGVTGTEKISVGCARLQETTVSD